MSIVICPSCGSQFQSPRRPRGTLKCPKCGFPIPQVTFPQSKPEPKPATNTSIPFSTSPQPAPVSKPKPEPKPEPKQAKPLADEFTDQPSPFGGTSQQAKPKPNITFKAVESTPRPSNKPGLIPIQDVKISAPVRKKPKEKKVTPSMVKINQPARSNGENLSSLSNLVKKGKQEEMVTISPNPAGQKKYKPKVTIPSIGLSGDSGAKKGPGSNMVSIPSKKKPSPAKIGTSISPAARPALSKKASSLESSMKSDIEMFKSTVRAMKGSSTKPETTGEKKEMKQVSITTDPQSLNDILKDLVKIDPFVKVSALVKRDGTILASAISTQVSDDLIVVIATTVSNIAKDIVFATDTGELKYISIAGTEGVTHLVPIVADIYLVILSGSGSKRGVIEVIARHVEKMTKQYLNV